MRYKEIIGEYQKVPPQQFRNLDFSDGKRVGKISTKVGLFQVWVLENDIQIAYGVIDSDPKNPIAVLGFRKFGDDVLMCKNAYTSPSFQRQGIVSELMYFVNKIIGNRILSDTQLTDDGEAVWKSLIKSSKFNTKIVYTPTEEVFDINDVGKKYTQDGTLVLSPIQDNESDDAFDDDTPNGQKFFYFLEGQYNPSSCSMNLMEGNILQPYRHTDCDF